MTTLFVSPKCGNCRRFVEAFRRSAEAVPALKAVRAVDVATLPRAQVERIGEVPAILLPDGRLLKGTDAFTWLDQYRPEPGPFAGDFGTMNFSGVGGGAVGEGFQRSYAPIGYAPQPYQG